MACRPARLLDEYRVEAPGGEDNAGRDAGKASSTDGMQSGRSHPIKGRLTSFQQRLFSACNARSQLLCEGITTPMNDLRKRAADELRQTGEPMKLWHRFVAGEITSDQYLTMTIAMVEQRMTEISQRTSFKEDADEHEEGISA